MATVKEEEEAEIRVRVSKSECSASSSYSTFCGDRRQCRSDRMVKIELDAAQALADFAQMAKRESGNPDGELCSRRWGNKGRRSRKRIKNESKTVDLDSRSLNLGQDCPIEDRQHHKKVYKNVARKTVKIEEQDSELPKSSPQCSTVHLSFVRGRSKQHLSEVEREARRLRRVIANRESARQTIRRRQAFCEELTKRAADLASDNENMKRERDLVMKEYQSLKDTNKHLKEQIAKTIKSEEDQTPSETVSVSTQTDTPPTPSSTDLPLVVYNKATDPAVGWPSTIENSGQMPQPIPQNAPIPNNPLPVSEERCNLGTSTMPNVPFYVFPYPWFFPLPCFSDSCSAQRDGNFVDSQHDTGSSSRITANTDHINAPAPIFGNFSKGITLMPTPLRVINPNLPIKCEDITQSNSDSKDTFTPEKMCVLNSYPNKKMVDPAAAAEARKRRKELTKLKNFHNRQLRMHC